MERRKAWWGIMLVIAGLLVVGVLPAMGQTTLDTIDDFESYLTPPPVEALSKGGRRNGRIRI